MNKKKVLVISDSAFVRQFLKDIINKTTDLIVTATVSDQLKALELLKTQVFDVIVLDIELAKMDGVTFLNYLSDFKFIPVVIISPLTKNNTDSALKMLSFGAVEVIAKPAIGYKERLEHIEEEIVIKIRIAAYANLTGSISNKNKSISKVVSKPKNNKTTDKIIAIGASTGGTVALEKIFKDLSPDLPGIIIIQHMPEVFTAEFARTLDQISSLHIKEAENGEYIHKGTGLVVPGQQNLTIKKVGSKYMVKIEPQLNYSLYNPSINHTFQSIANQAGADSMGIILTGMGDDGAKGLKEMFNKGAYTIAQDEKTSVIFGMPQKAIEIGAVSKVVALNEIAQEINNWGYLLQENERCGN